MRSEDVFIVYVIFILFIIIIASCGNPPHRALQESKNVLDRRDHSCRSHVHDLSLSRPRRLEETLKEIDLMSQEISAESVEILIR